MIRARNDALSMKRAQASTVDKVTKTQMVNRIRMPTERLQTCEITDYQHIIPKVFRDESPGFYSFSSGSGLKSRNHGMNKQKSSQSDNSKRRKIEQDSEFRIQGLKVTKNLQPKAVIPNLQNLRVKEQTTGFSSPSSTDKPYQHTSTVYMQIVEERGGPETLSPGTAARVNRLRPSCSKDSFQNYVDLRKSPSPSQSSAHGSSKRIVMQKQAS